MAQPLKIALLQCDHVDPALRHVAGDYDDMFSALFEAVPEIALASIDVVGGQPVPAAGEHDGVLITGSRHSAYDELPWIPELEELVRTASGAEVPVVGICFGHQVIARALGGTVERASAGWGVGVHRAEVTEPRWWMEPPSESFHLLVSHQDQVSSLPEGATVVATSAHSPVAAFEVGSAIGFQGHPEFVHDYAAALMEARRDRIPADRIAVGQATLSTPTDHRTVARWISRFLAGR